MSTWTKETSVYIIQTTTMAKIYSKDEHPFGLFHYDNIKEGDEQLSFMDENHVININRQITNDTRYLAYFGKRHTLIGYGRYKSYYVILLCSLKSETFLIVECEPCRMLDRFRYHMYNNLKTLVFKTLYEHYYMEDIPLDQ